MISILLGVVFFIISFRVLASDPVARSLLSPDTEKMNLTASANLGDPQVEIKSSGTSSPIENSIHNKLIPSKHLLFSDLPQIDNFRGWAIQIDESQDLHEKQRVHGLTEPLEARIQMKTLSDFSSSTSKIKMTRDATEMKRARPNQQFKILH